LAKKIASQFSEDKAFPRIALLYALYFGVDGKYFAWKSAIQQCFTVGIQTYVRLDIVGGVVSGPVTKTFYYIFFALLVMNIVLPPLLLSSSDPRLRRQIAMVFDMICDLCYIVGINFFYFAFTLDVDAITPLDIGAYVSTISPALRVLYVARTYEKILLGTAGNVSPSKLPRKAALGFGVVALAGFALALIAKRDGYPWNLDACRPCECSEGLVLDRCSFEGHILNLSRRGITGIKAGAFKGAPKLRKLRLSLNDLKTLPTAVFNGASDLEWVAMDINKISSCEAGAFRNLTKLEHLQLDYNLFSSFEDFNGAFSDLPTLELLTLIGNRVSCDDLPKAVSPRECLE
jgi:hypothetical protein